MLLNNFFYIKSVENEESANMNGIPVTRYKVEIHLDSAHPIFHGHFPGNPVVPGVCQVQMITETLSQILSTPLLLTHADNIKFLSMINPTEYPDISLELTLKNGLGENVTASLGYRDKSFLKFKGVFNASTEFSLTHVNQC